MPVRRGGDRAADELASLGLSPDIIPGPITLGALTVVGSGLCDDGGCRWWW